MGDEINLFNCEIIAHKDLLRKKNELTALSAEIESTLRETVFTIGVIEGQRSKETSNHSKRVMLYSQLLAGELILSDKDVDPITVASPLHDIGKLGIPDGSCSSRASSTTRSARSCRIMRVSATRC